MKLLSDRIAVKKLPKEEFSQAGIFLGESEEDAGEVKFVGPGAYDKKGRRKPMWDIKPGDKIFFSPHGNTRVTVDGEELVIIHLHSIMGVVEQ